jgi:hypothetical protein
VGDDTNPVSLPVKSNKFSSGRAGKVSTNKQTKKCERLAAQRLMGEWVGSRVGTITIISIVGSVQKRCGCCGAQEEPGGQWGWGWGGRVWFQPLDVSDNTTAGGGDTRDLGDVSEFTHIAWVHTLTVSRSEAIHRHHHHHQQQQQQQCAALHS